MTTTEQSKRSQQFSTKTCFRLLMQQGADAIDGGAGASRPPRNPRPPRLRHLSQHGPQHPVIDLRVRVEPAGRSRGKCQRHHDVIMPARIDDIFRVAEFRAQRSRMS